jgi:LmbE family N-acetylglucosaminyl deacetylase
LRAATLYEDYPYAEDPREVAKALGEKRWRPETVWLTEEALAAKTAAVACYRSQISTFWPDAGRMAAAVRAFAERVGRGKPAERYWLRR